MFKRVEKRLKRREEEEKLGIDDETRDVLGLNDTDSEESESDSDLLSLSENELESSEDEGGDGGEVWGGIRNDEMDGDEEEEEEGPRHIAFPIFTTQQALDDPVYAHPTQDNAHLCSICPGKTLISAQSISQHLASKAHERRLKHLVDLASNPEHADSSLSDLMHLMDGRPRPGSHPEGQTEGEEGTYASKRAEKKHKAAEIRKAKREKRKARQREKRKAEEEQEEEAVVKDKKTKPESAKAGTTSTKSNEKPSKKRKKGPSVETTGVPSEQAVVKDKKSKPESSKAGTTTKSKSNEKPSKKRKKGLDVEATGVPSEQEIAEKIKEIARSVGTTTEDSIHAPPKKKRKTSEREPLAAMDEDDDSPRSTKKKHQPQITQTIKDIAKSATKRARFAQTKAAQSDGDSGGGSSKRKRGKRVD
ncbi:hypothetical protein F5887DRAFT_947587 [Amanita rubescens]|nr:hypothetical protein F5887DRAFT_947587 [Amanita rubescens]